VAETVVAVGEAVAAATARLTDSESPRLDAELLLAEVLRVGRGRLVLDRDVVLDGAVLARFDELVARRAAREPVAYILGRRGFREIEVAVDPRVLIPRPETELLVEAALELPEGASVLDVGSGSGAVALAVKSERPDLAVRGVDVDPGAVAVAAGNAARLGLDVAFVVGDLLDGVTPGSVDAVLANLPYVPDGAALAPDVAAFEPPGALFGGPDGLDVVRRLVAALPAEAGWPERLALEIGAEQGAAVAALLRGAEFAEVEVRADLAGLDRVVMGRR
jgi:release factor glutamine methyltransferase